MYSIAVLNDQFLLSIFIVTFVIGIAAEKQGLNLQALANLNPEFIENIPSSVTGNILSEFPGKTFLLANGQGVEIKSQNGQFPNKV